MSLSATGRAREVTLLVAPPDGSFPLHESCIPFSNPRWPVPRSAAQREVESWSEQHGASSRRRRKKSAQPCLRPLHQGPARVHEKRSLSKTDRARTVV